MHQAASNLFVLMYAIPNPSTIFLCLLVYYEMTLYNVSTKKTYNQQLLEKHK